MLPPLPNGGLVPGKKSIYRAPGGKLAQETCAGCPEQRFATGEPGKAQGTGPVESVFGVNAFHLEK